MASNEQQPTSGHNISAADSNSRTDSNLPDTDSTVGSAGNPVANSEAATTTQQSAQSQRRMTADEHRRFLAKKIRKMYPWSAFLFIAACASTWYVGGLNPGGDFDHVSGAMYSAGVMGILLAHELGHYIQALRYKVPASPPMFIPMPFTPLGTMGAVIIQGAGYANRKALFDIAISGPLAGLVFALPIAWWGVQSSIVDIAPPGVQILGDPLILEWMYEAKHGPLAPGEEVVTTPLLFAGWVGIFITALNLMPIGQLDGGHILYTLIGRKAHWVAFSVVGGAIAWMVIRQDPSFAVMILLISMFGLRHPPSADDSTPIGPFRVLLGWLTLGFVLIGFTPFPISVQELSGPGESSQPSVISADDNPSITPTKELIVPGSGR